MFNLLPPDIFYARLVLTIIIFVIYNNMVKPFRAKDGMNLVAFDKMYGQFRNIDAQVSADIMSLTELNPRIV